MADDSQLPAVRQERMPVADLIPVFDTAKFDHYGRIASVLARSSFLSETVTAGDAVANCFQLVELADRWRMSPFALAQGASVVHGKLMLEGKVIYAALRAVLGIQLYTYFTGKWGHEDFRIYVTDRELDPLQVEQLEPHQKLHGVRIIDGSVKEWRTKEKGGAIKGNWLNQPDVQLTYRGTRTWTRVYEPGLVLGVLGDDEIDDLEGRRLEPPTASAPALTAGPPTPKKSRQTADKPPAQDDAGKSSEAAGAHSEPAQDAEFEDGSPTNDQSDGDRIVKGLEEARDGNIARETTRPTSPEADTATETAQTAEPEPDSPASATDAQADTPASEDSSPPTSSEPQDAGPAASSIRKAPPGEIYLLCGDEYGEDGKRQTYKDGAPWSRIPEKASGKLQEYDEHAPAADGEAEQASTNEVEKTNTAPADDAGGPIELLDAIGAAKSYLGAKQVLKDSPVFREAPDEVRMRLLRAVWDRRLEVEDDTAPESDYLLFELWLRWGAERRADIEARFPKFWRGEAYKKANDEQKRRTVELSETRKGELG